MPLDTLTVITIVTPLFGILCLLVELCIFINPSERHIKIITSTTTSIILLASIYILVFQWSNNEFIFRMFDWYHIGKHEFSFDLEINTVNALFASVFMISIKVVGYFSSTYLHRDSGFFRFHLIYLFFTSATMLTVYAANFDTLFIGWECVGLASILLIAYFHQRESPARNSLYTLVIYRIGEIALIAALMLTHIYSTRLSFEKIDNFSDDKYLILVIILAICAAFVKAAQLPFSSWLPRAMEGPTSSSAVFYGGIATHLGPLLLIKMSHVLLLYKNICLILIIIALSTAIYATIVGRTRPDIKTQLAYATIAQLGIIFAEIGFGFIKLAIFHCLCHCLLRTFQFLKSPSALNDYKRLNLIRSDFYVEKLIPLKARVYLHSLIARSFGLHFIIFKPILILFIQVANAVHRLEKSQLKNGENK